MGVPRTLQVRSISKLGLSMVTVVFEDSVNVYFARQLVNERLQEARGRIPPGLDPSLGPVATAFGELYQYTLEGPGYSVMDLKTLHDWELKYQLRAVPGVSEVNTWGGFTQQYHVIADPARLRSYSLSLPSRDRVPCIVPRRARQNRRRNSRCSPADFRIHPAPPWKNSNRSCSPAIMAHRSICATWLTSDWGGCRGKGPSHGRAQERPCGHGRALGHGNHRGSKAVCCDHAPP